MGRRKIAIEPIVHERNRSVTFLKRKTGLFKKAFELGVLCNVDIAVMIFEKRPGQAAKLYQYSSSSVDDIIQRQLAHEGDRDNKGPSDFNGHKDDDDDEEDHEEREAPPPKRNARAKTAAPKKEARSPSVSSAEIEASRPSQSTSAQYNERAAPDTKDHVLPNLAKRPRLEEPDMGMDYPPYYTSYRPNPYSGFIPPSSYAYANIQRRNTLDSYPARMEYNYTQAALYHQRMQQQQVAAESGVDLLQAMFGDEQPRPKSFPGLDWPVHGQAVSVPGAPPPPSQQDWLEYLTSGPSNTAPTPDIHQWSRDQPDLLRERQEALQRDRQDALFRERQEALSWQRQHGPTFSNPSMDWATFNPHKRSRAEEDDGEEDRSPREESPDRGRTRTRAGGSGRVKPETGGLEDLDF